MVWFFSTNNILFQGCPIFNLFHFCLGNSWGSENGQEGLGLGQQEEFYGCSDVSIQSSDISSSSSSSPASVQSTIASNTASSTISSTEINPQSTTDHAVGTEINPTTTTPSDVELYPGHLM